MTAAMRVSALVLSSTIVLLAGCGGSLSAGSSNSSSGSSSSGQLASGGASSVYLVQGPSTTGSGNLILQFNANSTGSASPAATLSVPTSLGVSTVATDSSGQIYVGGFTSSQGEILVYASGATGSATPLRTIIETTTFPEAITIDSAGLIYVTGPGAASPNIAVFSASANGNSTPIRLIQGALTQLAGAAGIAVDSSGDVYVTNTVTSSTTVPTGLITIFASDATGNVAPMRLISSGAEFGGITLDAASNIYAVENSFAGTNGVQSTTAAIVEFSNGSSGSANPTKVISGDLTGLTYGFGLARDAVGNIYLVNQPYSSSGSPISELLAFAPSAQGNVAPGVSFRSNAWTFSGDQIALK